MIWSNRGRAVDSLEAPGSGSGTGCAGMTTHFYKKRVAGFPPAGLRDLARPHVNNVPSFGC